MDGGDGIFTIILGIVTLVIGIARLATFEVPSFLHRSTIVTGIITGILVIIDHADISNRISQVSDEAGAFATASVGAGIWTLYVGAILAIIAGFVLRGSRRAQPAKLVEASKQRAPEVGDVVSPSFLLEQPGRAPLSPGQRLTVTTKGEDGAVQVEQPDGSQAWFAAADLKLVEAAPVKDTKICPQCAEGVKAAARVCRFCGHQFDTVGATAGSPPPPPG